MVRKQLTGEDPRQLLGLISGEGGTKKSFLLESIIEWSRLYSGKTPGLLGPVIILVPTDKQLTTLEVTSDKVCYA